MGVGHHGVAAGAVDGALGLDRAPGRGARAGRRPRSAGLPRVLPWLGPAFVAAVAYIDPGNFATNIAGGAAFDHRLLWVLLWSNLMAILIQYLSAKLGIVSGRTLPENCRAHFSRPANLVLWLAAEAGAMATDLAEILGGALGLRLLFGLPLWLGALGTAGAVFAILGLERAGFRRLEAGITAFVAVVGISYAVELFLVRPEWGAVARGMLVPSLDAESGYVAVGMLGATVMPHVVHLHSALVLPRRRLLGAGWERRHLRHELADILVAMNGAWLINSSMIVLAAATFFRHGTPVDSLEEAYRTLSPLLGPVASGAFGLALLASGLASSAVGTLAGQVILEGFRGVRISVFLRRLITLAPALAVILAGIDPTRALIFSQVILSFALPFALVPLFLLTRRRSLMGECANARLTDALAGATVAAIVGLNGYLLWQALL